MSAVTPPKVGDTWFRYEDGLVGHVDEWGELGYVSVTLSLLTLTVSKVTPKGVWLSAAPGMLGCPPRFVLLSAKKRYALPTKEEALESLMARKSRQIRLLERRTTQAKTVHAKAKLELARLRANTAQVRQPNELLTS